MTFPIKYSKAVQAAKEANTAIVALESTIITHGMPYPQNIETAKQVEQDIVESGATPATIAVIDGVLHIGLEEGELDALGQAKNVDKLSRADFAHCITQKRTGATTVAATMIAAHLADIHVFATGGIGGVHKGAEDSFDISADLHELSKTPVTVVAAGAKAILDLPKTFEVLETLGVPVMVYGQDVIPAFWSQTSHMKAPLRVDSADAIAQGHAMRAQLNLSGGQLVCNPIPFEDQIPQDVLEPIIKEALQDAEANKISAKKVTPFLLQRIFELTNGQSLKSNIALVRNNAKLAAKIAICHKSLTR